MQRLRDERGAVAVMVGLLIVPLIGFAAIAIDVSAMWAEKREVQNGADAGALAIAQVCAKTPSACTPEMATSTAQSYATWNRNGGAPTASIITLTTNMVTVRASDPHENWFAQVFDKNESTVNAQATVKWGGPVGGGTFPLTFSWCEWNAQTGGLESAAEQTIQLSKHSGSDCTGPSGNPLPGGFGWVQPNAGACTEASKINDTLISDTGNTPPSGCKPEDFDDLLGKVILIPIFDQATGSGNHGEYHIYGYAAFKFTGYYFSGTYKGTKICSGNDRCISGYFTRYVDLNEVLDIGPGPQLGLSIITLTD